MKACKLLPFLLLSFSLFAQDADTVLDKWAEAMGGEKANSFKTIYMKSTTNMAQMVISAEVFIKEGGKLFTHTKLPGGMEQKMGCDGKDCYMNDPMGLRPLEGQELEMMTAQYDMSFADWRKRYEKVEYKGKVEQDGKSFYNITLTTKDGMVEDNFYDASTYLMTKSVITAETTMGNMTMTMNIDEFQDIEGVKFPKAMTMNAMNMQMNMTMDEVQVNIPIPDSKFKKPAGLQ